MIRFENGVNIIYGKNGAGKSSVVDAIRFALFGEKRGDKIAELIRSNTRECSVTIGFRLDEVYFEVFRSLTLGKTSITGRNSWIKRDGVMIAETSEGVTKEIQNGLRIPKDIFLNSVFVRQGEMDALISETPANREKLFSKIIGIDVLSENAQKIKSIRDILRLEEARYSDIKQRVEKNFLETAENEEELKKTLERLTAETTREEEMRKALLASDQKRNEALRKKARYDETTTGIADLASKVQRMKQSIEVNQERMKKISFSKEEKDEIEKNPLFSGRSEVSRYFMVKSETRALEVSLENVRNAIEDFENDQRKLETLQESHHRFSEIDLEIKPLEEKIKVMNENKALKKSLNDESEREKKNAELFSNVISAQEYHDLIDLDREKITETISALEKDLRRIEGQRNGLKERIGGMNRQLADLRKNKDVLGDNHQCPVCGSDLDEEHLIEIHSAYQDRENEFLREIGEAGNLVTSLNAEYHVKEEKLSQLRRPGVEKFFAARDQYSRLLDSISSREKRISELRKKIDELPSMEEKFNRLRDEREKLLDKEKEFNSITYAMSRIPIDTLQEKYKGYVAEESEKKGQLDSLTESIGFRPEDSDREKLEVLSTRYERIRRDEGEYQKVLSEVESERRTLEEFNTELSRKTEEKESLGDASAELDKAIEKYNADQNSLTAIRQEVATLSEKRRTFQTYLDKLKNEMKNLEDEKLKLARIKEASTKLDKLREAFERNGIQALIRKDSSVSINNMTRNYLSSFNFEFDDVRIDENFDIRVINNGVEEPLDSMSGGERISLAIAVRLAIAKYLTGRVGTVIMDEPTNFLDEDRRNNLKDIIKYSLKDENMIQQMIMITHHSELTSAADSSFEVTKSNGISSVVPG